MPGVAGRRDGAWTRQVRFELIDDERKKKRKKKKKGGRFDDRCVVVGF